MSQVSGIIVNNPIKLGLPGEAGYSIQNTFVFHFCFVSKMRIIAFINAKPIDFIKSTCHYYLTIPINIHLGKIKFNSADVYSAHNKCKTLC